MSANNAASAWALSGLSNLLPLDNDSLKQIIEYTNTLSKPAAAEHLKNLLGDSPAALEFITSFNSRRQAPEDAAKPSAAKGNTQEDGHVPPVQRKAPKKKNQFNKLPEVRKPQDFGNVGGAYLKRDEDDYMPGSSKAKKLQANVANALLLQESPDNSKATSSSSSFLTPNPTVQSQKKMPPSAAGPLISDIPSRSKQSSRNPSPAAKATTKIKANVTGGTAMHGASTALDDLDSAIRALEIQTNPSFAPSPEENRKRRCNCMATRHPLLEAAPNCMNCGKVICVKEGLGPCTFCEKPLLSNAEIQSMVRILKEERGKERMEANNASHRRADISKSPRPFQNLSRPGDNSRDPTPAGSAVHSAANSDSESEKLRAAQAHRDKLLSFQANNARRTRIHDEASDFETPAAGTNMWASPAERALQLRRQQKILREQEWQARPEWEKRKVVASIDLVGGKIVKRMAQAERPQTPPSEDDVAESDQEVTAGNSQKRGAFSRNPLLGHLIKPKARESESNDMGGVDRKPKQTWRRVQDDNDNEEWILDGGAYGGEESKRPLYAEEPA